MKISIIIPTHNRLQILKKCLFAISKLTFSNSEFEVILIDDGSNDGTHNLNHHLFKGYDFKAKYLYQEQCGPAKARNKGIKAALGELLIIIGDDIMVTPNFLQEHLEVHKQNSDNIAVIGRTNWDTQQNITNFMKYLENGIQFAFNELKDKEVSYKHCYTSNISIKKSFIQDNNIYFMEEFPHAAYEDIEWGYRLMKKGLIFRYNENALAYHNHPVSLNEYKQRMVKAGKAYAYLCKLHPEINLNSKKTIPSYQHFEKSFKATYMEFILQHKYIAKIFQPFINEEKWIKKILAYYEEKGIKEENAKFH